MQHHHQDYHRTTPFSLAYGIGVMILMDLGLSSAMKLNFDEKQNAEAMNASPKLIEKKREPSHMKKAILSKKNEKAFEFQGSHENL